MAAQLRLQDAKQKLLTYGKMAQKTKEEAMTEFENDEYKSDDQHICDWVQQNVTIPSFHTLQAC
jgi:flagellar motor component MotA